MALISKRNFKTVLGAAHLSLTAKKGESLLVKNVMVYEPTAHYVSLMIEKTTVGFFRVASLLGNHLQIPFGRAYHSHDLQTTATGVIPIAGNAARVQNAGAIETPMLLTVGVASTTYQRMMNEARGSSVGSETILQYLAKLGLFNGYPVESGQTFLIELATGATAVKMVEYEIYDEADMKADMPNGSKSSESVYISYGDHGAVIQAQINPALATPNNTPEFPDFPFGEAVPSGKKIDLLGILASDVAPAANVAANATETQFLKLMKGTDFLFDEDLRGLLYWAPFLDSLGNQDMIGEGYAVGGNYTQCDRRYPFMFDPALTFKEGEQLFVAWQTLITGAGAAISRELHEVGFILRMSNMSA